MLLNRCPHCHAHITLDGLASDAAARDLLYLLACLPGNLGQALLGYLGLWRPLKRDMGYARALKLAQEVLDFGSGEALVNALFETTESLRSKGGDLPLTSHQYLKKVLSSVEVRSVEPTHQPMKGALARVVSDGLDLVAGYDE